MRYLLVGERNVDDVIKNNTLVRPTMSGVYAWLAVFAEHGKEANIDNNITRQFLENYDVVHVNYVHSVGSILPLIRSQLKRSSTVLVANVDHSVDMWDGYDLARMKNELSAADIVFHVEPVGAKALELLLDMQVHVMPHPVDDVAIRQMNIDSTNADKLFDIACVYHRYHCTYARYYTMFHQDITGDKRVALINYSPDPNFRCKHVKTHFNAVIERTDYPHYISNVLPLVRVVVEIPHDYVFGRSIADACAVKVPVVSSTKCYLGKLLSSRTCMPDRCLSGIRCLVHDLLTNDRLYDEMVSSSHEACIRTLGLAASYSRFKSIVEFFPQKSI